ncbi:MAG: PAS domain-containing protein [Fimbriiglobus sp.]|nr:PAS domain-containing protein [Fimbriiglobus sp.]
MAYLSIPVVLLAVARHPALRPVRPLIWLFAAFILACGTSHLMEAIIFIHPLYRLSGVVKGITAVVSWATVFALVPQVRNAVPILDQFTTEPAPLMADGDRRSRAWVFVFAIVVAILSIAVRAVLHPVLGDVNTYGLGVLAITFMAWYGGYAAGLITLFVSAALTVYFFIPPRLSVVVAGLDHQIGLGLYLFVGLGVLVLGEVQRITRQRLGQKVQAVAAAAERLREGEERFRAMADGIPQLAWMARPDGHIFWYNRRWLDYTGLNPTVMEGWGWEQLHDPAELPRVKAAWQRALETTEPFEATFPLRRYDGQMRWHLTRAVPHRDEDGAVMLWFGTNTDVTTEREMTAALNDARRFSESVLHSLPGHLVVLDVDGRILGVNESWRRFGESNGIHPQYDWTQQNYFAACDDGTEFGRKAAEGIRAVANGTAETFDLEYPCPEGDDERHYALRVSRFRGDGPVRLVILHDDITARVQAERRVRDQASELVQLVDGLPLLAWACRSTGECEYVSRQWLEYTGQPAESQLNYGWLDTLHPDDRPRTWTAWQAAVEGLAQYDIEFRIRRHDGVYRWFAVRGIPVRDQTGQVARWYGSCTDVEDRVRQAEVLEALVEERTAALRESNQELENFAYIASHDLQEPLRKIQAFGTRLATKCRPQLGDTGQDYVDRMLDSATRMRRLIDDLLSFSRVTNKEAAFTPVDLNAVFRDVLNDLEDGLHRTGGRVEVAPLPTVLGDQSQLRQVFLNLIANALKFSRPGRPPVVRVTAEPFPPDGDGWRLIVSDNGIGFEAQYADRIFELFQRLHGRDEYEGTGLGLAIARKIVHRHGASIHAIGHPGEGAEFVIDWPVSSLCSLNGPTSLTEENQ